jgi:uncharacterized surface protein with fasciclin (FAS1) repeats
MNKLLLAVLLSVGLTAPAFADDLLATLAADGSFKTFSEAVKTAGLEDALKAEGPITLFAPNDAAFAKVPKAKLKKLLADKEALAKLVEYHIVQGKIGKADVDAGSVKTMSGDSLALSVIDGVKVNNVAVAGSEIDADNGVIHVVTAVLTPKRVK